ncbi:MAG: S8 family serine peptidase [Chlorobiaceae bacterium]|nr:S8 family serine peptidase [Chlorobiaceae bacterium]
MLTGPERVRAPETDNDAAGRGENLMNAEMKEIGASHFRSIGFSDNSDPFTNSLHSFSYYSSIPRELIYGASNNGAPASSGFFPGFNFNPFFKDIQAIVPPMGEGELSTSAARIISDVFAPTVRSFSPSDGSSNVALATNIVLTFSEPVKAGAGKIEIHSGSATGAVFESFNVATSSRISFSGSTLTIDPVKNLSNNTQYFVTLSKGTVVDLVGNSYAGTSTYDFRTFAGDIVAPTVRSFTPSDGSTNVALATNIILTFSESVKAGSGVIEIHSGSATGAVFESFNVATSSRIAFSGTTLTIDPVNNLSNNTQYFVTLSKGTVLDIAGNSYAGTSTYDFKTIVGDIVAPTVTSFTPADGSTGIAVGTNISLTFSESVKAGTGLIEIHSGSATGSVVESFNVATSGRLAFSGTTLTIDPVNNLANNTQYYVTLGTGAVADLAGNSYAGTSTYDFKTVAADTTAPTVTSFTPVDGTTGVAVGTNITLTFSEAVKAGAGLIEIHSGSTTGSVLESFNVASSSRLAFSGSKLVIDPVNSLANNTQYFVTFAQGTVVDLAGNSFAGTSTYDFKTIASSVSWNTTSGYGLLNVDAMLEKATGKVISDAPLFGDGYGNWDWGLNDVQAPDAWQAGYTGKGVVVAVIDTGVDYTHSELGRNIWINKLEVAGNGIDDDKNGYVDDIYGYDFVNNDGYAFDDHGHGTHVSGIIAGLNNGYGVTGVAYDATIMPVKVLSASGSGSFAGVAAGVMYAVNNGANVINMSLGAFGAASADLSGAIAYAINHGVIVCMASGNDYQASPTYPAVLAKTTGGIAVGAVDSTNIVASFSNDAGTTVPFDFVDAPGVFVFSTYKGGGYAIMSGTSMATPYVAGAAALLLSAKADFSSAWSLGQLENILTTTAQAVGATGLISSSGSGSTSQALAAHALSEWEYDSTTVASPDSVTDAGHEMQPIVLTGLATAFPMDAEVFIV